MKNGYDEIISLQGYNCGSCALPFLSLPPYLETKFHFNRFLLSKIWPRTGNTYEKLLWGDNSIHIQGMIMVLVHCPFPYCHLSIYYKLYRFLTVYIHIWAHMDTRLELIWVIWAICAQAVFMSPHTLSIICITIL